jgi:hypothetical protein
VGGLGTTDGTLSKIQIYKQITEGIQTSFIIDILVDNMWSPRRALLNSVLDRSNMLAASADLKKCNEEGENCKCNSCQISKIITLCYIKMPKSGFLNPADERPGGLNDTEYLGSDPRGN